MATRPPTPTTDPRADEYRRIMDGPPTADHVAELRRLGLPIPATQGEASAALTAYYIALARLEVGR